MYKEHLDDKENQLPTLTVWRWWPKLAPKTFSSQCTVMFCWICFLIIIMRCLSCFMPDFTNDEFLQDTASWFLLVNDWIRTPGKSSLTPVIPSFPSRKRDRKPLHYWLGWVLELECVTDFPVDGWVGDHVRSLRICRWRCTNCCW